MYNQQLVACVYFLFLYIMYGQSNISLYMVLILEMLSLFHSIYSGKKNSDSLWRSNQWCGVFAFSKTVNLMRLTQWEYMMVFSLVVYVSGNSILIILGSGSVLFIDWNGNRIFSMCFSRKMICYGIYKQYNFKSSFSR